MKRILLPTDFSDNAFNAIKYAVQLFENEACIFYLLNTYTPVLYDTEHILYSPSQLSLDEIYKNNSLKGLKKVEKKLKQEFHNPKHTIEQVSSFNLLNEEIPEQVKEKEIDLVIMGTQGATGAVEILFGTNTVHAIKKTKVPLMAIPSNIEFGQPKNILFPTDYDINYTAKHVQLLKDIANTYNSEIHILHVIFGQPLAQKQEKYKKILDEYFKETDHKFYSIEKNTVTEGIYDFQKENPIDLLVMISNKHSFFQNLLFRPVINDIGFHVKIPFLVIPSGKYNS